MVSEVRKLFIRVRVLFSFWPLHSRRKIIQLCAEEMLAEIMKTLGIFHISKMESQKRIQILRKRPRGNERKSVYFYCLMVRQSNRSCPFFELSKSAKCQMDQKFSATLLKRIVFLQKQNIRTGESEYSVGNEHA